MLEALDDLQPKERLAVKPLRVAMYKVLVTEGKHICMGRVLSGTLLPNMVRYQASRTSCAKQNRYVI